MTIKIRMSRYSARMLAEHTHYNGDDEEEGGAWESAMWNYLSAAAYAATAVTTFEMPLAEARVAAYGNLYFELPATPADRPYAAFVRGREAVRAALEATQ